MADSAWSSVAAAVVSALDAALSVPVFDGPANTGDSLERYVCVGAVPESDEAISPNAGAFTQDYHNLGAHADRDERGNIACYLSVWTGDNALSGTRTAAFALFDSVNDVFRDNPTLGLTAVMAPEIEVGAAQIMQGYTTQGCRVVLSFNLTYRTII